MMRRNAAAVVAIATLLMTVWRAHDLGAGGVYALILAALAAFYAVSAYELALEQRRDYGELAGAVRSLIDSIVERDAAADARADRRLVERAAEASAPRRAEEYVLDTMARDARR